MQYGPKILDPSGLVLTLDAGNLYSYPGSGTTWTDLSGNNNDGTLINGPTYSNTNGGIITFDGTNDYVTGSISNLSVYTVSIFMKILGLKVGGGLFCAGTQVVFQMGGANVWQFNSAFTGYAPTVGQWYYTVGVQTASTQILYINNTQVASASATTSLGTTGYVLGRRDNGLIYVNYQLATVSVYSRVLSTTEMLQHYNLLKGRFGL